MRSARTAAGDVEARTRSEGFVIQPTNIQRWTFRKAAGAGILPDHGSTSCNSRMRSSVNRRLLNSDSHENVAPKGTQNSAVERLNPPWVYERMQARSGITVPNFVPSGGLWGLVSIVSEKWKPA